MSTRTVTEPREKVGSLLDVELHDGRTASGQATLCNFPTARAAEEFEAERVDDDQGMELPEAPS